MPYDSLLFDFDGTLVDTADDLAAGLNHALGVLGRPAVTAASVRQMVGRGARALLERALAAGGGASAAETERGLGLFLAHYAEHLAVHTRPFPGVDGVLDRLANDGWRLAICTNKPVKMADELVRHFGWAGRFQAILGGDSLPWKKPDRRHVEATLAAAGGRAAIFIGDSPTDAEAAHNAGVPLVLVRYGYTMVPVEELGADQLLDRFDQLPAALAAIQGAFNGRAAGDRA